MVLHIHKMTFGWGVGDGEAGTRAAAPRGAAAPLDDPT
jgi:hypothetical protein